MMLMKTRDWSRFCLITTLLLANFMFLELCMSSSPPTAGKKAISIDSEDGSGSGSTWLWPTPIFNCTSLPLQPTATNVNQLRFQDIKAFMTVGDSISAGSNYDLRPLKRKKLNRRKTKGLDCIPVDCTIHSI